MTVDEITTKSDAEVSPTEGATAPSWIQRCRDRWPLIALALLTLATAGVAVGYFFVQYRPDRQTDEAASKAVLEAAYDGTMALLTYTPETFDAQMAAAKTRLTGDFLTYYGRFTDQVMGPAVKQRGVQASVRVVRGAVSELQSDSAVVLLFVDQTNVSKERPQPGFAASCVRVTLAKVDGSWLISKFEPA